MDDSDSRPFRRQTSHGIIYLTWAMHFVYVFVMASSTGARIS